jgi:hypothetical protein
MLLSPDTFEIVKDIPYKKEFTIWKNRLTSVEYETLVTVLAERVSGQQICTSSWLPGTDWTNTPFQIIYEKACNYDEQHAAMFFGLILWDTMMRHADTWCFGKFHQNNVKGTTYFKVQIDENRRRELYFKHC